MPQIDICFSPIMYPAYQNTDAVVVIVDIFRATSCICTAFANGVKSIIPVETIKEAIEYKNKGYLVAAERNVQKCDFADFGNSPFDFSAEKVKGKDIVFTTTNGTKAIHAAKANKIVVIGSFLNLSAVVDFCAESGKDIIVLCSGWNDKFNLEDTLFGGALAACIQEKYKYEVKSDAALVAINMWEKAQTDTIFYLSKSEHVARLYANGFESAITYCLQQNIMNVVPTYKYGYIRL